MIRCGWCGQRTSNLVVCESCGRDPEKPYRQRGVWPPQIETPERGRPHLDHRAARRRVADAEHDIAASGRAVTTEAIAEHLGVSVKTVRRWRE